MQINGKLKQQNLEKRHEGYHQEDDGLLIYKNRMYIPNATNLRRIIMDEIHKMPYYDHPRY